MALIKQIRENPFAAIGLLLTLAGVALSVANYLILQSIQPLDYRVRALEERNIRVDPIITDFAVMRSKVDRIDKTVDKIADRIGVIN